nr:hypothetical protein [Candidatus Woesearchaeota archaeon]
MDLEIRLAQLMGDREIASKTCEALISRSHSLFERARIENSYLKRKFYFYLALEIQRFGIRYSNKGSKYLDEYIRLRDNTLKDIKGNAKALGYKVELEPL